MRYVENEVSLYMIGYCKFSVHYWFHFRYSTVSKY